MIKLKKTISGSYEIFDLNGNSYNKCITVSPIIIDPNSYISYSHIFLYELQSFSPFKTNPNNMQHYSDMGSFPIDDTNNVTKFIEDSFHKSEHPFAMEVKREFKLNKLIT